MNKILVYFITSITILSSSLVLANESHDMSKMDKKDGTMEMAKDKMDMKVREIDIVTEKINDKVRFSPSVYIAKIGETIKFKIYNATDKPHGFSIDEFNLKETVQPGDNTIEFKADKLGLYKVYCQYHPAHLTGQLLVQK